MIALAWLSAALAFPPVLETNGDGSVDWTNMRLVASSVGRARTGAMMSLEALEGDARDQLGPDFVALARGLRIDRDRVAGAVLDGGDVVADRLDGNLGDWEVYEARYLASGGVELDAALSLQAWLRPLLVTLAANPETPPRTGGPSGLVIDARGIDLSCAVAPEVIDESGAHLYGIVDMTRYAASLRGPVVYVRDPADPVAVRRAGDSPLIVRAARAEQAVDIVVGTEDAGRLRAAASAADFLRNGLVVVVVGQ